MSGTSFRDLERALILDAHRGNAGAPMGEPEIITPAPTRSVVDEGAVARLRHLQKVSSKTIDLFRISLLELLLVERPELKFGNSVGSEFDKFESEYRNGVVEELSGVWVMQPDGTLLHQIYPDDYYRVRTSRNEGLISSSEQKALAGSRIVISGLSVGSMIAVTLAMEGCREFYLSDMDLLAVSNLNRLHSSVADIGRCKTDLAAERIWRIDPFSQVTRDNRGYSEDAEKDIFSDEWMPDLFIDAMDDIDAKLAANEACKKYGIPLIWLGDIGDGVVQVGCERYDLDQEIVPFSGRLVRETSDYGELSYAESILAVVGREYISTDMIEKVFAACNGELPGFPQLSSTVAVAAGVVSYTARKLLRNEPIPGEFAVKLSNHFST